MNSLTPDKQSQVIAALVEGNALHFMHYNFCRVHQTLRVTPAMEAGISDHVWSIEEIVNLLESNPKKEAA